MRESLDGDGDDSLRRHDSASSRTRDLDAYEATELARIRTQYSQATESRRQATQSAPQAPHEYRSRALYEFSKFWLHEISVTVDHKWCRDHLGAETFPHCICCRSYILPACCGLSLLLIWKPDPVLPTSLFLRLVLVFASYIHSGADQVTWMPWRKCHIIALERTFLGYLRTSLAISMLGILVAQLFTLQHSPTADRLFGYFVIGKPLACMCQFLALFTLLLGAFRFWRLQHAIVREKTLTGGFELVIIGLGVLLLCITFCVLLIAADVSKED